MRRLLRLWAAALIAVGSVVATASPIAASALSSPVVGHVYVNNNTAGTNTISGFDRHADGSLTGIAGTPYSAGGAGTGSPTGSAGALQLSSDHRFLLAVDAGSNQISVMTIRADGSLRLATDPVSSGGTTPLSLAVHNSLVYVANAGAGGSNYTGFRLLGRYLLQIPFSSVPLPDSAMPGQILFGGQSAGPLADLFGTGLTVIGTRVGPSAGPSYIDSFTVGWDGRLTPAPGSPLPAQKIGPFGSAVRPTNHNQLFVSNAHDGPLAGSVSAYTIGSNSALTPIGASPFADNQTAPCWVAITPDGQYLFAVNTGSGSISGYSIAGNGGLSLVGSTTMSGSGLKAFDAAVDPSGHFLYVVDSGVARISAFSLAAGTATELAGSSFAIPGGGAPFGMVVD